MNRKFLFAGLALAALALGMVRTTALAQSPAEDRMRHLHHECDRGDRRACVQFGIMIGENRERHAEWQRSHPEWWWWR
jgi:hypothetical protein